MCRMGRRIHVCHRARTCPVNSASNATDAACLLATDAACLLLFSTQSREVRAHSSACTQEPFEKPFLRFSFPPQPSSALPPPQPSSVQPLPRDFLLLSDFLSQFAIGGKDPGRPEVRVSVKRALIHSQKRPIVIGRPRSHVPDSTNLHKTAVDACSYLDPTLTHACTHVNSD